MEPDRPTDECISKQVIQRIHDHFAQAGIAKGVNELAEREAALAAYVICAGHFIADTAKIAGAPKSFCKWVQQEVIARMLVCVESQRQAHYELWRDFMGDTAEPTKPQGGHMADDPKPRVSALAMAKRSDDFATVAWTPEDVRRIRPAWSAAEARHFLEKYQTQLAAMILEAGWTKLLLLIEQHEKELRDERA